MRILVLSDNHHEWNKVEKILSKEQYDFAIHLGDAEVEESKVNLNFDKYVSGNHDQFKTMEDSFELEGIKFAILHGHSRGLSVFDSIKPAVSFAKSLGAEVVLHGHTHIVCDELEDGVRVICPGSIANARTSHGSTYMIIEVEESKVKSVELKYEKDL